MTETRNIQTTKSVINIYCQVLTIKFWKTLNNFLLIINEINDINKYSHNFTNVLSTKLFNINNKLL